MSAVLAPLRRRRSVAPGPDARHLQVVEAPRVRHTLAYALAMIVLTASIVFGAVALNALAAGQAVDARQLDTHVAEAERLYAQLVADVAALEDPARIHDAAVDLGLVPSRPMRFVALERNLPADGAVTEPTPGRATDPLKPLLSAQR